MLRKKKQLEKTATPHVTLSDAEGNKKQKKDKKD